MSVMNEIKAVMGSNALAVPDFVAGFVFGLTNDNHLHEVERCFHGSQTLIDEVVASVADFGTKNYIGALTNVGKTVTAFPDVMSTCENMDNNIDDIRMWSEIFTQPPVLIKTLTANWGSHR